MSDFAIRDAVGSFVVEMVIWKPIATFMSDEDARLFIQAKLAGMEEVTRNRFPLTPASPDEAPVATAPVTAEAGAAAPTPKPPEDRPPAPMLPRAEARAVAPKPKTPEAWAVGAMPAPLDGIENVPARLRQRARGAGGWRLWWEPNTFEREAFGFEPMELDPKNLEASLRSAEALNDKVATARRERAAVNEAERKASRAAQAADGAMSPNRWTDGELADAFRMLEAGEKTCAEIARLMRKDVRQLTGKWMARKKQLNAGKATCITCKKLFASEGAHDRLCQPCSAKTDADGTSGGVVS